MTTTAVKTRFNKNFFEQTAWAENNLICGIDEVGRGCLAGPVVVAAVVLFPNKLSRQLRDSKIMTPEEREKAALWITKNSWYNIGIVHHRLIDLHNIYYATLMAMKRAYVQLMAHIPVAPKTIVVDAMPLKLDNTAYHDTEVLHFPFGESKSSSIAAASILAKITRDRLMKEKFETIIPGYEFASHKGYSTPPHKRHVRTIGPSIIHRLNFVATVLAHADESQQQQSILEDNVIELSRSFMELNHE